MSNVGEGGAEDEEKLNSCEDYSTPSVNGIEEGPQSQTDSTRPHSPIIPVGISNSLRYTSIS